MFDLDRWQEILNAIRQNKFRSVLTAFGVFWAIFMLIVMTGSGNALVNGITHGFKDFATNSAFMWASRTTVAYQGYDRGRSWSINNTDIENIREEITEIEVIAPRLQGWDLRQGENVVRGERSAAFSVMGDYPAYRKIDPCTMIYGRYINDMDIELKRKVCIIGEQVHAVMFDEGEDPVGKYMRVNGVYFMVVGVFRTNNPNVRMTGSEKREIVYLPFTTMQQTFNYGDQVHFFGFTTSPDNDVQALVDRIKPIIKKQHKISPKDEDAINGFNLQSMLKTSEYTFLGINILIWVVGIGTLIAGAIGVSNIMLIVVKERTKEIGIQRAIGARPAIIVSQILTESVFLTTVAGFLGLALGTLVLHLTDMALEAARAQAPPDEQSFFMNPEIGLPMAVTALILLILVGLFAGLIPALKAVKLKPIEALHHE